jgi:Ca2+-transporting ATPase
LQTFFKEAIDDMAARSLRCVAIAYRSYDLDKVPSNEQDLDQWSLPEDELILLAIVGIKVNCKCAFSCYIALTWCVSH